MDTREPRKASFLRKKEMYASTLLSSASESSPHTLAMMSSLGTTAFGVDMSSRSTSYSLKPSRTDLSPRRRLRLVRSSVRSPAESCSVSTSPCLRVRARTRASSSPASKGLVI